jgi:hypothetical protein
VRFPPIPATCLSASVVSQSTGTQVTCPVVGKFNSFQKISRVNFL